MYVGVPAPSQMPQQIMLPPAPKPPEMIIDVLGIRVPAEMLGSVSKVEMVTPMALIYKVLFPSISTFETPPGAEIRALRKLKRLAGESPYVFLSERKGPLTDSSVRKMWPTRAKWLPWAFRCIRTNSGMRVGISWPMRTRIRAPSNSTWGIGTFNTR